MKIVIHTILILFLTHLLFQETYAQSNELHGDQKEFKMGVHSGNLFRLSFFNDGTFGATTPMTANQFRGEWPIGSGHLYLINGDIFAGAEVINKDGQSLHIISENRSIGILGSYGDSDPATAEWWTFLPLPGFSDPDGDRIAMAKGSAEWPNSWPAYWPDKMSDTEDPGWRNDALDNNPDKAAWNGYFGKNVFNADEESYFVADDYMNREFMSLFLPDTLNTDRGGLGIRMYVRNFQWSKTAFQDALITHYSFENIGTYNHDKMIFAIKISNNMGDTNLGGDAGDDMAGCSKTKNLVYEYDLNDIGADGWSPVGYFGGAFLETPGNFYDGIDNDNDGKNFSGPVITEELWQTRTLTLNNTIVMINYDNYERIKTTLDAALRSAGKGPQDTLEIKYRGRAFKFWDGKTLIEDGDNLFDDNLNGIIDENRGLYDQAGIIQYLYLGYKYIDFFTDEGLNNPLIDERRDDGVDNDADWSPITDDVGADGAGPHDPGYSGPDQGEGDGIPTAGEPDFDQTDIDETDMLGLTSCNLYSWIDVPQYDDQLYWELMTPGLFSVPSSPGNYELLFGSGYFGIKPGESQRFSTGFLCATSLNELVLTKDFISEVYKNNYRLPKAPPVPELSAETNQNNVTISWDDIAEKTPDPVLGDDFEGYRIYKFTDPDSLNAGPSAQFDLINNYSGSSTIPYNNEYFFLGNNSGIQHSWIDSNLVFGKNYYYLITSYDHGNTDELIAPTESNKEFYYISKYGEEYVSKNAVIVRAVDSAAEHYSSNVEHIAGLAEGGINCEIVDTRAVERNNTYRITFEDTKDYGWTTNDFSIKNMTTGELITDREPLINNLYNSVLADGFRLSLRNIDNPSLSIDPANSGWSREGIMDFKFISYSGYSDSEEVIIADFEIRFGEMGVDTSQEFFRRQSKAAVPVLLPSIPVNFTIINKNTNQKVPFAFRPYTGKLGTGPLGNFDFNLKNRRTDEIIFLQEKSEGLNAHSPSWQVSYNVLPGATDTLRPGPGDVLTITLGPKPFLSPDIYEFTMPDIPVSVNNENNSLPKDFTLSQNYPNPFNPTTYFKFSIPKTSFVSIKIFDILGSEVATLVNEEKPAGNYTVEFSAKGGSASGGNAGNLASGIYFCRMQTYTAKGGAVNFSDTKKIILIK
ncbi:MAG TPA: T9SS type A sorting domain-containing protein [Ignavibacteriaceae bacterium]|nr:T9SS type A sorting domain-containing protein [Ignavibacteriaceae bacterium]